MRLEWGVALVAGLACGAVGLPCISPVDVESKAKPVEPAGAGTSSTVDKTDLQAAFAYVADDVPAKAVAESTPTPEQKARVAAGIAALSKFDSLIGGWRGVGQEKRNSARGSWQETAEWVWDVRKTDVALVYTVTGGKVLESGRLTFDQDSDQYTFVATLADKSRRTYVGKFDEKEQKLTVATKPESGSESHQLTIQLLNEKRTIVAFAVKRTAAAAAAPAGQVGYTREGTRLAEEGVDGPECIVTGGKGTMTVSYKGQTYYVCCSGCKSAFEDDPEGVLADAADRARKKAADKAAGK
jgi:YHS domain-containing protein